MMATALTRVFRRSALFSICAAIAAGSANIATAEPVNPFAKPPMIIANDAEPMAAASESKLILRGVLLADTESLANISGTLYGIDENVAGMRIEEIGADFVTLAGRESQLRLTLADTQQQKRTR